MLLMLRDSAKVTIVGQLFFPRTMGVCQVPFSSESIGFSVVANDQTRFNGIIAEKITKTTTPTTNKMDNGVQI